MDTNETSKFEAGREPLALSALARPLHPCHVQLTVLDAEGKIPTGDVVPSILAGIEAHGTTCSSVGHARKHGVGPPVESTLILASRIAVVHILGRHKLTFPVFHPPCTIFVFD